MTNDNSPSDKENKSFWNTLTGTIVKITALLSAITGLILAINSIPTSGNSKDKSSTSTTTIEPGKSGSIVATSPATHVFMSSEITAFLNAAKTGDINELQSKLDLGIDVDINLPGDPTNALVNAIDNDQSKAVELLLNHKANPNAKVRGVSYPIIEASFWGRTEIVSLLIQNKADLNIRKQDGSGITSLMFACLNGHKDVVQKLVDSGAEVDIKCVNSSTALDFANASASASKGEIIAILNSVGAHSGH